MHLNLAMGLITTANDLAEAADTGKAIATLFELVGENPFKSHLIQPTIIYDFPLAVSPLSKIKPDEPDWVERFEFYIGGFEIGNAFSELNDPDDQLRRFQAQIEDRKRGDEEAMAEVDRLRPRPGLRPSAHRRRRHRHRPPHHGPHRLQIHPRRHPLSPSSAPRPPNPTPRNNFRRSAFISLKRLLKIPSC